VHGACRTCVRGAAHKYHRRRPLRKGTAVLQCGSSAIAQYCTFLLTVQVIQSHVFIGSVDDMFCLIQHLTQLYVVHVPSLSKELM
jgi:hypothetical protein